MRWRRMPQLSSPRCHRSIRGRARWPRKSWWLRWSQRRSWCLRSSRLQRLRRNRKSSTSRVRTPRSNPPIEQNEVLQSIMRIPEPDTAPAPAAMMMPMPSPSMEMPRRRLENLPRPPNYKTVPCRLYHSPVGCARGEFCHFIHDPEFAGRELPSDLWKSKRRHHESSYYGPPPPFPGKMPIPLQMLPFLCPPPMGQPPMRMPNFPPMMPRGFMAPPRGHSPERGREKHDREHDRDHEHDRDRGRDHDRHRSGHEHEHEHSHRSRSHGSRK